MTPEEFLKNFGVLVEVPGGLGNLREMILELAFQGRLVAPVASDESAKELIQQIVQKRGQTTGEELGQTAINSNGTSQSPEHWCWTKLGQIAEVSGGITKGRNLAGRQVTAYPYLRVANVQRNLLNLSVMKEIEIPVEELGKYRLLKGDILFTEGGDWDKLGRSAVWEDQLPICLHQNHVFKARLLSPKLNPRWFSLFANSPSGQQYFASASKQTTNLASINITQLRNLPVPVPPVPEQTHILAKVDQLMALCDELEARQTKKRETGTKLTQSALDALTSAEGPEEFAKAWQRVADNFQVLFQKRESMGELRKAILGLAVRGRLAPQHQDEEPAATLLERIRAPSPKKPETRYAKKQDDKKAANSAPAIFDLPLQWQWATFTEVASIESCLVDPLEHGDQPHIAPDTIEKGTGRLLSYRTISEDKVTSPKHQFRAGQILYSKIRPNLSKAVAVDFDGLCSADMYPITSRINTRYLLLCMLSDVFLRQVVQGDNRLAMPKVNQQQLAATVLPIPPLVEQQRIVAKVDQLLALCDTLESKLRDAEQGAQRLAEAMVAEMVA